MNKETLLKGKIPCDETGITVKKSICSICNPMSHCGLDLYIKDGEIIKVQGMQEHKGSRGTLCSKGAATRQYVYNEERMKTPLKRVGPKGSDQFEPISWEEAYETIGKKLNENKKEFGPEATAFFVGYTKWMRPFAQRMAHNFGSPNYSTESSTCAKATAMAYKLNYGFEMGPDVKNTNCLLVWSSNPFHTNTSLADAIMNKQENGMKMIVVDPRVSPIAARADIHLQLKPGTDGALALGMGNYIVQNGLYEKEFIEKYAYGFEEYKEYIKEWTLEKTQEVTGVEASKIEAAAKMYASVKPAAFMPSASPVVHHTNGVQNYRAAMLLIALTGNVDIAGGNLDTEATYLDVCSGYSTNWQKYILPKKWEDLAPRHGSEQVPVWCELLNEAQAILLPKQILSEQPYKINTLVGFGLNHRMWPDTNHMIKALEKLDFFVNIDIFLTDTCKYADIVLPACTSVERGEFKTYGNGYCIYTQPAIKPLHQSKSDADIIFELIPYLDMDDDLMNKGYEANVDYILEPSGMTVDMLKKEETGMMSPTIQPPKYQKYLDEGFKTPSGKIEFVSQRLSKYEKSHDYQGLPVYKPSMSSHEATPEIAKKYPFIINTGSRLPMYVHSRTFRLPWIKRLRLPSYADISPIDANEMGIIQDDKLRVSTPKGEVFVKANITGIIQKGMISIYHGYKDANVNLLIDADYHDPISAFPGFKSFLGNMEKVGENNE